MGAVALIVSIAAFIATQSAAAADPPLATTDEASGVSATDATLKGKVNPKGGAVASCRFEYGTTPAYGAVAPCEPSSLGVDKFNVAVSAPVSGLEPGTTYHYRLVAASVNGATSGSDRSFVTEGTPSCPNAARRLEQGILAIQLPDCMALEQVSPPMKFSQRAASPTISANGDRVGFYSLAALADTPGNLNAVDGDAYLADRGSGGWVSAPTSPPFPYALGWSGSGFMARSFDPELSRWLVLPSTQQQFDVGVAQLFRDGLGGGLVPLSSVLTPLGGGAGKANVNEARLHGVSADHTRAYLAMGQAGARYFPTDPVVAGSGTDRNVYVAGLDSGQQPSLSLMARDKDGKNWGGNCGARLGGVAGNSSVWRDQGAVAANGSRTFISARAAQPQSGNCSDVNTLRILERLETPSGVEISELIESECDREAPEPSCSTTDGDDLFQGASVDQSKVYFTTNRQLASSDLDGAGFLSGCAGFLVGGCDLYLYDAEGPAGERLTQVSAGEVAPGHPTVGSGAEASNGTVAISGDGSQVYFTATGVLTAGPNPEGKTAAEFPAADPKLYAWDADTGALAFVGGLVASDSTLLWDGNGTFLNGAYPVPATGEDTFGQEVGGDGGVLFFLARAQLTAEDADGTKLDAYRYDAEATPPTLQCISCRPGGPDAEPFDVTPRTSTEPWVTGTGFAERGRWVSEDGESALIRTVEGLVEQDLNGFRDDYLWSSGGLTLIPGTSFSGETSALGQAPPVLSHDGDQVAFTAYAPLLPSDVDTAPDIYVARSGGGFPFPVPGPICLGEGCRPTPTMPPGGFGAASESTPSRGNVVSAAKPKKSATKCPKGKRKVTRAGKDRCVKVKSKKGSGKQRRANRNLGGQK